jgi:hypothetical protein
MGGRTRTSGQGRPKGIPNKTTVAAREAFQMAFDKTGGPEALAKWAMDNQTEFYKLFARLIPVDVNASGGLTINIKRFGE